LHVRCHTGLLILKGHIGAAARISAALGHSLGVMAQRQGRAATQAFKFNALRFGTQFAM
jgi:hypothetical protein